MRMGTNELIHKALKRWEVKRDKPGVVAVKLTNTGILDTLSFEVKPGKPSKANRVEAFTITIRLNGDKINRRAADLILASYDHELIGND
jgi:hypothetical protein